MEALSTAESDLLVSIENIVSLLRCRGREHATACGALVQAFCTRLITARNRLKRGDSAGEDSAVEWVRHASLYGVCLSGPPIRETDVMGDLIAIELRFETSQIPTDELRIRMKPMKTAHVDLDSVGTDAVLQLPHKLTHVKYVKESEMALESDAGG